MSDTCPDTAGAVAATGRCVGGGALTWPDTCRVDPQTVSQRTGWRGSPIGVGDGPPAPWNPGAARTSGISDTGCRVDPDTCRARCPPAARSGGVRKPPGPAWAPRRLVLETTADSVRPDPRTAAPGRAAGSEGRALTWPDTCPDRSISDTCLNDLRRVSARGRPGRSGGSPTTGRHVSVRARTPVWKDLRHVSEGARQVPGDDLGQVCGRSGAGTVG